jgi:hypothetical protein
MKMSETPKPMPPMPDMIVVLMLYAALKDVVDAADGKGWEELDPSLAKQREALKLFEKL